jgi:hypothetical protein
MSLEPYYADDTVTLYHGDALGLLFTHPELHHTAVLTDPPYGIAYSSGAQRREGNARSIRGDRSTALRDVLVAWLGDDQPAMIFGSPRIPKPVAIKGTLVWDKGGALGMGDLSLPWKFDHEEVYVLGTGWVGRRDSGSVIRVPPVQSVAREHPNAKPIDLLLRLLEKFPARVILDPFAGSGSTLVAAKQVGRKSIGVEIEERYCEIAARRLDQGVLDFGDGAA